MNGLAPGFAVLAGTFPRPPPIPAEELLRRAADDGYRGLAFPTPAHLDPREDTARLREMGQLARELGLALRFGVGTIGPTGADDAVIEKIRVRLVQGHSAGCDVFLTFTEMEPAGSAAGRREQLDTVTRRLTRLTPTLSELGCRLDVKTHEDISSRELFEIVERVASPRIGVGLDVANLVVRGEDPVRATARLAPHINQAHLEDVALVFTPRGAHRYLLPCGDGVMDWRSILDILRNRGLELVTLEQHRGDFEIPFFEQAWVDAQGGLSARDLSAIAAMAWRTAQLTGASGSGLPAPGRDRDLTELSGHFARSREFLRPLLTPSA